MCSWSFCLLGGLVAAIAVFVGGWYSLELLTNRALFPVPPRSYSHGDFPMMRLELAGSPDEEAYLSFHEPVKVELPLVILYCHGNGGDLGRSHAVLDRLANFVGVPVAAVEYPGYGVCRGSPSEDSLNRAVLEAMAVLETELGYPASNIVLYGRSIGSGPASAAAAVYKCDQRDIGGLILQSPFTSIRAVVRSIAGDLLASLIAERFDNAQRISQYYGPLLIIHGTQDKLIPHQQGRRLHELCPAEPELKWISLAEGADHNHFDIHEQVERPIHGFVHGVLARRLTPLPPGKPVLEAFRDWRVPADSGRGPGGTEPPSVAAQLGERVYVILYPALRWTARAGLSAWRRVVG